ncbi:MAG: hypothetical protein H6706_26050 [Myxococcales bacterium]|nr:hypothetical protein [Myxococcales bacterium]
MRVAFSTAAQTVTGCGEGPTRGLPPEVDRVIVQMRDVAGEWQTLDEIPRDGGNGALLERVPVGVADLRLVGCEGPAGRYEARPAVDEIPDSRKRTLVAHFRRGGSLTCAGTGFGPAYDVFAALPRSLAFGTAVGLPGQEQILVAGGAGEVLDERLQARADDGQAWSLFDWRETLFWPGVERSRPITHRALDQGRVGLEAAPWQVDTRLGLLLIGGAPSLSLETPPALPQESFAQGPLVPTEPLAGEPGAAFFDATTGAVAPVTTADGQGLVPRVLAGIGRARDGRVLRAGGLGEGPAASAAAEVFAAGTVARHTLPAPLLGPTVTPLGADAFLVWGADVASCGQTPGYLVTLDPVFAATPLQIPGAPTCDDACRDWYATAYHTATLLAPDAAGRARVLVIGGLVIRGRDLLHNPDPGGQCAPNAFVIAVDVAAASAEITPIAVPDSAQAGVRRVLHRAAASGARVMITGGWGSFGKPTSFVAGDDLLFYDDAEPAGSISVGPSMARRRFGHIAAELPEGRVLIAGGVAPEQVVIDEAGNASFVDSLALTNRAEFYTPPVAEDPCPAAFAADDAGPEDAAAAEGDLGL